MRVSSSKEACTAASERRFREIRKQAEVAAKQQQANTLLL